MFICNIRFWAWLIFEKAYKLAITSVPLKNANIIKNWSSQALEYSIIAKSLKIFQICIVFYFIDYNFSKYKNKSSNNFLILNKSSFKSSVRGSFKYIFLFISIVKHIVLLLKFDDVS